MSSNIDCNANSQRALMPGHKARHTGNTQARSGTSTTSISHNSKTEVQSGNYAIESWLQQSPQTDPWNALARLDGQLATTAEPKKGDDQEKTKNEDNLSLGYSKSIPTDVQRSFETHPNERTPSTKSVDDGRGGAKTL